MTVKAGIWQVRSADISVRRVGTRSTASPNEKSDAVEGVPTGRLESVPRIGTRWSSALAADKNVRAPPKLADICLVFAFLASASSARAVQTGSVTTTIYVTRHFEVRDHDQPTKYVFNGATRVAEITGSLSTNLRVQRLRLYPGWNLCSLAVTGPLSPSGGGNAGEVLSAVFMWEATTQGWKPVTNNESVAAGTVLWLRAKTNITLAALGTYSDPQNRQVQPGAGYFSAMGLEGWSPNLPPEVSAWFYDPPTRQWSEHLAGSLAFFSDLPSILPPGQAFYLQANAAFNLAVPEADLRIRYYHQDHLGSSSVTTDANGAIVEETAFYPFGLPRNEYQLRSIQEHYKFTQKERDLENGLHYFEARFLAAGLARFGGVDPLGVELKQDALSNPQKLNPYAYALNNPVRLTDPMGLEVVEPVLDFITKWGRNAGPVGIVVKYIKLNAAGFHDLQDVSKAVKNARGLISQINDLERGARALRGAVGDVWAAEAALPNYPLKAPAMGVPNLVSAEELDYVRKYYNTAKRVADEGEAARRELDNAIAGWDAAVYQANKTDDFTRKAVWEEITDLDMRFSKEGGGFRAYLVNARDIAARESSWARTKQYHAADILGEWTPSWYQAPSPPYSN